MIIQQGKLLILYQKDYIISSSLQFGHVYKIRRVNTLNAECVLICVYFTSLDLRICLENSKKKFREKSFYIRFELNLCTKLKVKAFSKM